VVPPELPALPAPAAGELPPHPAAKLISSAAPKIRTSELDVI
jgi:hypothetical protein